MVCFLEVLEQDRDLFLVCTPFHVLAKLPLQTLHVGKCWVVVNNVAEVSSTLAVVDRASRIVYGWMWQR